MTIEERGEQIEHFRQRDSNVIYRGVGVVGTRSLCAARQPITSLELHFGCEELERFSAAWLDGQVNASGGVFKSLPARPSRPLISVCGLR